MNDQMTNGEALLLYLPAELTSRLRVAASDAGKSLEQFLLDVADRACPTSPARPTCQAPLWERPVEEQIAAWEKWCDSHTPVSHFVDDSRESIYAGRGE